MRRLTYLIVGLIFLSLSCAGIPVKSISQSDLEDLRGKWKGTRYGIGYTPPTELEILNTTIPISASITFHETRSGTLTYPLIGELQDGKLFFFNWDRNEYWVKLTLRKGNDKMRLEGDYQWGNYGRGTLTLSKN